MIQTLSPRLPQLNRRFRPMDAALPQGQREREDFPRFGMPAFAAYRGTAQPFELRVKGRVAREMVVAAADLSEIQHMDQVSDLHCVTTWSYRAIRWSGYRFKDVYERILVPGAEPHPDAGWVVFRGADGYRASLLLEDALAADVMLADQMNNGALSLDHGAPLRLVAPAHYAYKSVKHLSGIEFWSTFKPGPGLLEHPRARTALEERGRAFPGKLLRYAYKPLIRTTVRRFRRSP